MLWSEEEVSGMGSRYVVVTWPAVGTLQAKGAETNLSDERKPRLDVRLPRFSCAFNPAEAARGGLCLPQRMVEAVEVRGCGGGAGWPAWGGGGRRAERLRRLRRALLDRTQPGIGQWRQVARPDRGIAGCADPAAALIDAIRSYMPGIIDERPLRPFNSAS
ncbi:hypothetical protein GCM10025795_01380 [Verticiella sediminum]